MTTLAALRELEQSIRRSAATERFREACGELDNYTCAVQEVLKERPEEIHVIAERTETLFAWLAHVVLASREDAAAQLAHLKTLAGYAAARGDSHLHTQG